MAVRTKKLIDATINTVTTTAGSFDFNGVAPKRATLQIALTKTLAPGNLTLTVEVSPDKGVTLISYDKLIDQTGVDSPVSSVVYSATGDDVISLSMEDVMDYIKVSLASAAGTDATNFWTAEAWLVAEY